MKLNWVCWWHIFISFGYFARPVIMANPLAALGNILQGRQPDATSSKDIFDAVQKDEAADVETFLSRGVRINELNGVSCRVQTS